MLLLDFHYQIHDTFQFFHFFEISDFCHFRDFKMRQQNSYLQSIGVQSIIFPNYSVKSYLDFCIQIKIWTDEAYEIWGYSTLSLQISRIVQICLESLNPYYSRAGGRDSALRLIFYLMLDVILVLLLDFHYQIHDTFQFFHFFKISDFCHFCDFKMLQQNCSRR